MYYISVINVNCYSTKVENFANERIFQGLDGDSIWWMLTA